MFGLRQLAAASCFALLSTAAFAQVPRAFVPASNSIAAPEIAGASNGGSSATLEDDGFLFKLHFDEHRDRPCFIRAEFWRAPAPGGIDQIQRSQRTLNVCSNNSNPPVSTDYPGWTILSMRSIGQSVTPSTLTLIDQIAVIDARGRNNDRIKAARVRFGDLRAWWLNQNPVRLRLTDYDDFRRTNADGSSFSERSTCQAGRAAVGLIAYYDNHKITGLKLKCARVRRVDEQPAQPPPIQARPRRINNG
ncbi:MAG: hypothetical protein Rubg2KO_30180 [Rubricoccaceae bacterium]